MAEKNCTPDLSVMFAGKIYSPNPFWLASAPPTNCGEQVMRAFDAGWGGAVWKTLGDPIVNVSSRYSSVDWNGQRMMGLNNIELITDRPLEVNLREISEVKKRYPKHAVIASLMVESKREAWHRIVQQTEEAGADGLELNFGCPHGIRASAGIYTDDYGMGEGESANTGSGEIDTKYFGHSRGGASGETRRRGWIVGDQHN